MTAYYDPRPDWSIDDAEAARPALETLPVIWHGDHEHHSVTELEVCEDDTAYLRSCAEADVAYARHVDEQDRLAELQAEADYDAWVAQGEREADAIAHGSIDWHAACNLRRLDPDWSMS